MASIPAFTGVRRPQVQNRPFLYDTLRKLASLFPHMKESKGPGRIRTNSGDGQVIRSQLFDRGRNIIDCEKSIAVKYQDMVAYSHKYIIVCSELTIP